MSREELQNRMAVLLGGRAAELMAFGSPSTGAADDLAKATEMARAIVARYGMDPNLGLVSYEPERRTFLAGELPFNAPRLYSEQTSREIDCAVRDLIQAALATATAILTRARSVLEQGAQTLLEKESLGEAELGSLREQLHRLETVAAEKSVA